MTITREERPNGTNPFGVFLYTMSPANGHNMSSNGAYQLERFPRQFYFFDQSFVLVEIYHIDGQGYIFP